MSVRLAPVTCLERSAVMQGGIRVEPRAFVSIRDEGSSFFGGYAERGICMNLIRYIRDEIQVVRERDPAIKTWAEVLLYPGFRAVLRYRLAHKLYLKHHYFLHL